ncbi:MAG TPA: D-glycero-beta-D-manno-heptose-7-phosphate kinase [Bacteroidetes bacterium]|nr:D-glycero-beta-D-manno-heptose-7-phosphate kinase [Bacteroidota bacterium]
MVSITQQRIDELLQNVKTKRIAVIGDVMIDRYIWGNVNRISPEAPVPVVEVESESSRLGGAANVANNIVSLGASTQLIGIVGNDFSGKEFCSILEEQKASIQGIIIDPSRPTTVKTRVIAHHQHVVRIDSEEKRDIGQDIQQKIFSVLEKNIDSIDGIIIEDYNKGVVVKDLIHAIIELAHQKRKIITIDPKLNNFFEYKNVTVFKPNKKETEEALGKKLRNDTDVIAAGKILIEKLQADNILLTRSEKGMSLFEKNGAVTHIPTNARKVADVSGAGDTVIATLTAMLSAGATISEAALLANYAGGIVCGEVGIITIDPAILRSTIFEL